MPMQKTVTSRTVRGCGVALFLALQGCASSTAAGPGRQGAEGRDVQSQALARLEAAGSVARINDVLAVRRVARDAYVVTQEAGLVPANILVVRMPDGTLVLSSSPYDTGTTRAMLGWLRDTFHPRRMVAINTHFHPDGIAGNEAYSEAGVETYASTQTQELLLARGATVKDQTARAVEQPLRASMEQTRIVPAKHTFEAKEGLKLEFGGETVQVFYPGPAHSPDNVSVFFPSRKVLFGGCMIRAATAKLGYRGDADVANWEAATQSLEPFAPLVVVPGHGAPGGAELLQHTKEVAREARSAQ